MICPVIMPGIDTIPATERVLSSGVSAVFIARRSRGAVASNRVAPSASSCSTFPGLSASSVSTADTPRETLAMLLPSSIPATGMAYCACAPTRSTTKRVHPHVATAAPATATSRCSRTPGYVYSSLPSASATATAIMKEMYATTSGGELRRKIGRRMYPRTESWTTARTAATASLVEMPNFNRQLAIMTPSTRAKERARSSEEMGMEDPSALAAMSAAERTQLDVTRGVVTDACIAAGVGAAAAAAAVAAVTEWNIHSAAMPTVAATLCGGKLRRTHPSLLPPQQRPSHRPRTGRGGKLVHATSHAPRLLRVVRYPQDCAGVLRQHPFHQSGRGCVARGGGLVQQEDVGLRGHVHGEQRAVRLAPR
mmetsp:Transcript_19183/g.47549  ORF Transcript_19183/g.47549 Transcript_19183/m.47549 type:complete len:366 (-) Transcript_19183:644-1741(-)